MNRPAFTFANLACFLTDAIGGFALFVGNGGSVADSSDLDNAIIAKLGADATLLAICTNGVYWGESPSNSTRFVIVSLAEEEDVQMFGGRAFESALYLVKAVMSWKEGEVAGNIKGAAARIDALLDQQPLTVSGYSVTIVRREGRERQTEVDAVDGSLRWFHRGGLYRVVASS